MRSSYCLAACVVDEVESCCRVEEEEEERDGQMMIIEIAHGSVGGCIHHL